MAGGDDQLQTYIVLCAPAWGDGEPRRAKVRAPGLLQAIEIAQTHGVRVIEVTLDRANAAETVPALKGAPPSAPQGSSTNSPVGLAHDARSRAVPAAIATTADASVARRKNPWLLLGIGAGVGCVVGAGLTGALMYAAAEARANRSQREAMGKHVDLGPTAATDFAAVFRASAPACVTIRTKLGNGSGFCVGPALICTNAHVIKADVPRTLQVLQPESKQTYRVLSVAHFDPHHDIALLRIDRPLPVLMLSQTGEPPAAGAEFIALGSPGTDNKLVLENSVTKLIAAHTVPIRQTTMLQLSGSVNPGCSGGPVVDAQARVHAMVTAKATEQEGIAFAVLAQDVREAIEGAQRATLEQADAVAERHELATFVYRVAQDKAYELELLDEWMFVAEMLDTRTPHAGAAMRAARQKFDARPDVQEYRAVTHDANLAGDLEALRTRGTSRDALGAVVDYQAAMETVAQAATYPEGTVAQVRTKLQETKAKMEAARSKVCSLLDIPEPDPPRLKHKEDAKEGGAK